VRDGMDVNIDRDACYRKIQKSHIRDTRLFRNLPTTSIKDTLIFFLTPTFASV
jgi:hypothetical protein